jgi:hypothetical protein
MSTVGGVELSAISTPMACQVAGVHQITIQRLDQKLRGVHVGVELAQPACRRRRRHQHTLDLVFALSTQKLQDGLREAPEACQHDRILRRSVSEVLTWIRDGRAPPQASSSDRAPQSNERAK